MGQTKAQQAQQKQSEAQQAQQKQSEAQQAQQKQSEAERIEREEKQAEREQAKVFMAGIAEIIGNLIQPKDKAGFSGTGEPSTVVLIEDVAIDFARVCRQLNCKPDVLTPLLATMVNRHLPEHLKDNDRYFNRG